MEEEGKNPGSGLDSMLERNSEPNESAEILLPDNIKSGGLEGIIEECPPRRKNLNDFIYGAAIWPIHNLNLILGASLPISAYFAAQTQGNPFSLQGCVALGIAGYAFAFLHRRENYSSRKKPTGFKKAVRWLSKNYLAVGFSIAALTMAVNLSKSDVIKNVQDAISINAKIQEIIKQDPSSEMFLHGKETASALRNVVENVGKYIIAGTAYLGTLYSLGIKAFTYARPDEMDYWKLQVRSLPYIFEVGNFEKRMKALLRLNNEKLKKGYDDRGTLREIADAEINLGMFDEAVITYSRMIENRAASLTEHNTNYPLRKIFVKSEYNALNSGSTAEKCLKNAFDNLSFGGDIKYTEHEFEKALSFCSGEKREKIMLLYSIVLRSCKKNEKSAEFARSWLDSVDANGGLEELARIPSSRNQVFEITGDKFFNDAILLKRSPGIAPEEEFTHALQEHFTSNFLSETFSQIPNDFHRIVPSSLLVFQGKDKRAYQLIIRTQGRNLRDACLAASNDEKGEYAHLVMESSALIHSLAIEHLMKDSRSYFFLFNDNSRQYRMNIEKFDYAAALKKRLVRRLGENPMLENFMREAEDYSHAIPNIDALCHGDSYITNFLEDGSWVDLEKRVIANPMIDIAGLLECPELSGISKDKLISDYCTRFSEYKEDKMTKERLLCSYPAIKVFNSLCQIGSKTAQENQADALFFTSSAFEELERQGIKTLEDAFYKYIKSAKPEYLKSSGQ
jgi:hypothetical protein